MTAPMVPFLPPSARPSSLTFIDGVIYTSTSHGCGAAPNGVWALDLTADNKVTTWRTGGAHVAGSAGPSFGTDGTLYVATTTDASPDPEPARQQRRRARPGDASAEGLARHRRRGLQRFAGRVHAQGPRARRRVRQRRPPLPARRRVAGRRRPPDAAARHGEVLGGGHGRRPRDLGRRSGTRWIAASVEGGPTPGLKFTAEWPGAGREHRRVQAGRRRRPPDARAGLAVAEPGLAVGAGGGQRDGVGRVERRVSRGSRDAGAAQRRQRSVPARLYVLDAASGKPLWNSGLTITSRRAPGSPPGLARSTWSRTTITCTPSASRWSTERPCGLHSRRAGGRSPRSLRAPPRAVRAGSVPRRPRQGRPDGPGRSVVRHVPPGGAGRGREAHARRLAGRDREDGVAGRQGHRRGTGRGARLPVRPTSRATRPSRST